jgi:hypothetical protein
MYQVLEILAKNAVNNVGPDLVKSVDIADKLSIGLTETKHLLTGMSGMGIVECNMDVDFALITQRGFRKLSCYT